MAVYEYQAIAKTGKSVRGVIDADSPVAARRLLREQELLPTNVVATFTKERVMIDHRSVGRVGTRDVALFTRQLAVLLQAGMALVEALTAVIEQTSNTRLKKTAYDIRGKVNEGVGLGDAMAGHPRIFTELYVNMVRAGESSGALEQVLLRLADILERQAKLKQRILSVMLYPMVMATFGFGIIIFLMTFVVPKITNLFIQQKQELPAMTEALIGMSNFVKGYWWIVVIVVAALMIGWRAWVRRPEGRRQWDRFKLRLPQLGPLYMKIICARMSRTLGTMLQSGLNMMTALDVVKSVVQNRIVEDVMDDVKAGVRRGKDLAMPLKETAMFPPMLIHMVELGQRSGELENMLLKVADTYEDDVQMTIDTVVGLLEPIIIVVMGCFVGFLVVSILLPIMQMTRSIGH
ncbi:MAG: type II secretion system inner membrane protein GspF [Candidatus Hydrogenedentes bacterium]|nr:type II secretion system inner membrane protein GspF [Candidatus Hydrogenedentota bacterium]